MNNYQNFTWDDIKVMHAETAQLMKDNEQKLMKMFANSDKKISEMFDKQIVVIDKQMAAIDKQMAATDRQIAATDRQIAATDRQIAATDKQIATTDKQMKRDDKKLAKIRAENKKELKETWRVIKETDRQMKKNDEIARKRGEEIDKRLDKLGKYLGGVSNSNGDMAEEYFYNTLRKDKTFVNEKFDKIRQNVLYGEDEHDPDMECDIILTNGNSIALIEVKYRAKHDNIKIDKLIKRAMYLKEKDIYKNHNFYLGVAAMSFDNKLAKELRQAGIATIHHRGKKMVVYDKEVKVF
jgi:hypothetical protein